MLNKIHVRASFSLIFSASCRLVSDNQNMHLSIHLIYWHFELKLKCEFNSFTVPNRGSPIWLNMLTSPCSVFFSLDKQA